jgi:hypothetical protein
LAFAQTDRKDDCRGREIRRAVCRREGAAAATLLRRVRLVAVLRGEILPAAPALLRQSRRLPRQGRGARSRAASSGLADAQDILTATPRNIGAPERAARQCMPIDFYLGRGK